MRTRSFGFVSGAAILAGVAALAFAIPADRTPPSAATGADVRAASSSAEPHRRELLELAFDTASAIPVHPHAKDRAKAQAAVVETLIELDQLDAALAHLRRIDGWRRGAAYADLAYRAVERGELAEVDGWLAEAERIAREAEDWRRDRVLVKIARVQARLGRAEIAARLERGVVDAEVGKVDAVRARQADEAVLEAQLEAIAGFAATANFDALRNALAACAELHERFHADRAQRLRIEAAIRGAWTRVPMMIRIEVLARLAETALAHDARDEALAFVAEGDAMLAQGRWLPEHRIPLAARLAGLRGRAGDVEGARRILDEVLTIYRREIERILSIDRAGVLRATAEALAEIGEIARAREVYALAVDAGIENPNSRPRAEDLAATCSSLARLGIEPDAALWSRIRTIRDGLGDPW